MMMLKIVLHNKINCPVYLDVPVPPELIAAMRTSKITRAEFLVSERGPDGQLVEPKLAAITELNNFKVL